MPLNTNSPSSLSLVLGCQVHTATPKPLRPHNPCHVWPVKSEISWQFEFACLLLTAKLSISIYLSAVCISFGESCLHGLWTFPSMVAGVFLVRRFLIGLKDFSFRSMIRIVSISLCCHLHTLYWKRLHILYFPSLPLGSYLLVLSSAVWSLIFLWTLTSVIWFMACNFLARWEIMLSWEAAFTHLSVHICTPCKQRRRQRGLVASCLFCQWLYVSLEQIAHSFAWGSLQENWFPKVWFDFVSFFPCDAKPMAYITLQGQTHGFYHIAGASFALSPCARWIRGLDANTKLKHLEALTGLIVLSRFA